MWAQSDGPWLRAGPSYLSMLGCSSALNTRLASLLSAHQVRKSSGCHCHPQDLSHLSQKEEETLEALDWHTGFLCAKGNTDSNTQGLKMHPFCGDLAPGPQLVLPRHLQLTLIARALAH